jgi:hypothetical protein
MTPDLKEKAKWFPQFVKLPLETQLDIWEFTASIPRIVSVSSSTSSRLRASPPPILYTCSASRTIGFKNYTLAFGSERLTLPSRTYFNFTHDILYFRLGWNNFTDD